VKALGVRDVLLQDPWIHIGSLLIFSVGVAAWFAQSGLTRDPSTIALAFMIIGLSGFGVHVVNGSAAALRNNLIAQALASGQLPADRRAVDVVPTVAVTPTQPPQPPGPAPAS
jgi:hypothetical protein